MLNIRYERVVAIPKDYPTGYEVAKWLVEYVMTHTDMFKLRGRCVIKVTTTGVRRVLKRELGIDLDRVSPQSYSGYIAHILMYFDHMMEQRGFTLIQKKKNTYNTARYYTIPNCPG